MRIQELYPDERPREKMKSSGASSLSNAELLAILLRTGTGSNNAIDVARELLASAGGSLTALSAMSIEQMVQTKGVGTSKAISIVSAFELGRRFCSESVNQSKEAITSSSKVNKIMSPILKGLTHEECWVVFLNRANYVINKEKMTTGSSSATIIDTKTIIRRAIENKAESIILVHNHPSGNAKPSTSDTKETNLLKNATSQMGISLLDHIIVCDDSYYSFADNEIITNFTE